MNLSYLMQVPVRLFSDDQITGRTDVRPGKAMFDPTMICGLSEGYYKEDDELCTEITLINGEVFSVALPLDELCRRLEKFDDTAPRPGTIRSADEKEAEGWVSMPPQPGNTGSLW